MSEQASNVVPAAFDEEQQDAPLPEQAYGGGDYDEDQLIPGWLALLVLILLLAVFAVGGWLLNDYLRGARVRTPRQETVAQWREKVRQDSSDMQSHLGLGFAYQQDRQYDNAIAEYDTVLKANPKDTAALFNKGTVLLAQRKYKAAETTLWDVLEIEPTHALAAKELGDYYASKGQYRSLLVAVRPAVEARPNMADLQYLVGTAYEHLGQPGKAAESYRLALKYVPDMKEAREGLGRVTGKE